MLHVHPEGGTHLQDLNDLELGVHHHDALVVRQEVSFAVAQRGGGVWEALQYTSTHHHLSHHFSNAVDRAEDIIALRKHSLLHERVHVGVFKAYRHKSIHQACESIIQKIQKLK